MDLKMHIYSVPLRSPFAFPCVPWNFEVGERLWPEIRSGGTAFPRVLLHFNHWSAETKQPTVDSFVLFQFYFTMCDGLNANNECRLHAVSVSVVRAGKSVDVGAQIAYVSWFQCHDEQRFDV